MIRVDVYSSRRHSTYQPTHHQCRQPRALRRAQPEREDQARRPMQPMRESRSKVGPPGQPRAPLNQPPRWPDPSARGTSGDRFPTASFVTNSESAT
ncbi:hypothetical protein NDU88_001562 [Pleurodeles waltl]|uniref:Uncharacterized protein n=1 Tax=Pleurodeles waltl TaxID=8319 RepID=A0AAV7LXZ8_PLEWA|nr:hypothetical protein NDU88_001562 [Pleurodeles waltl]